MGDSFARGCCRFSSRSLGLARERAGERDGAFHVEHRDGALGLEYRSGAGSHRSSRERFAATGSGGDPVAAPPTGCAFHVEQPSRPSRA